MYPIINISFYKNPMPWELIHLRLIHPYEIVMREILRCQNLTGIPKHYLNTINEAPCPVYFIEKMKIFPKGTTFYTTNIQRG